MKTRWSFVGAALLVVSLAGVFSAYGQPGWGKGGKHWGRGGDVFSFRVLGALELTPEQQTKIQAINESHQATLRTLHHELRSVKDEIASKFLAPGEVSQEQLSNQVGRIAVLESQLFQEQLAIGMETRNVLTPAQLTRAAELIAKQKALHAEWQGSQKAGQ